MKKYLFMALTAVALITLSQSCKKKLTDDEITKSVGEALVTAKSTANVTVKDGVVTLAGNCPDQACKDAAAAAIKDVKGINGAVVNNITVAPPPATLNTTLDAASMQKVKDALKDFTGVTLTFLGDKAVLAGAVTDKERMTIMQSLTAAHVKSDVSKLTKK